MNNRGGVWCESGVLLCMKKFGGSFTRPYKTHNYNHEAIATHTMQMSS